jgi:hypothetical protein
LCLIVNALHQQDDLFFSFDQRMKGMQNKNNAQDIKDVYVRQYRALPLYSIAL